MGAFDILETWEEIVADKADTPDAVLIDNAVVCLGMINRGGMSKRHAKRSKQHAKMWAARAAGWIELLTHRGVNFEEAVKTPLETIRANELQRRARD